MPTFTPPTQPGVAYRGSTPPAAALFRHYGTVTEGRNVYILNSGVVTETDPIDLSTVAHTLWGGHEPQSITDDEATLLTAAGYGAYIT